MTTTRFENTQGTEWTTFADESALLDSLQAAGRLSVRNLGLSTSKNMPIRLVTVRLPTTPESAPGVLIVGLQHGNEPVSREAAISLMRDLAEGTDAQTQEILSQCQVHFITAANPAGHPDSRLVPGTSVDMNRSHLTMPVAEPRYVQQAITLTDPILVVDCHEWPSAGSDRAWMLAGDHPMAHPNISAVGESAKDACYAALQSDGIAHSDYPGGQSHPGLLRGMSAVRNCPFILVETPIAAATPWRRYAMYQSIFRGLRAWLVDEVESAHASKVAAQAEMTERGLARTTAFELDDGTILAPPPFGYSFSSPAVPHLDTLGIEHVDRGDIVIVPMGQPQQSVIPFLLDPAAPESAIAAERLDGPPAPVPSPPAVPPFRGVPVGMKVRLNGIVYPVETMKVRIDGVVYEASLPAP